MLSLLQGKHISRNVSERILHWRHQRGNTIHSLWLLLIRLVPNKVANSHETGKQQVFITSVIYFFRKQKYQNCASHSSERHSERNKTKQKRYIKGHWTFIKFSGQSSPHNRHQQNSVYFSGPFDATLQWLQTQTSASLPNTTHHIPAGINCTRAH